MKVFKKNPMSPKDGIKLDACLIHRGCFSPAAEPEWSAKGSFFVYLFFKRGFPPPPLAPPLGSLGEELLSPLCNTSEGDAAHCDVADTGRRGARGGRVMATNPASVCTILNGISRNVSAVQILEARIYKSNRLKLLQVRSKGLWAYAERLNHSRNTDSSATARIEGTNFYARRHNYFFPRERGSPVRSPRASFNNKRLQI